jgi:hypothetical protein
MFKAEDYSFLARQVQEVGEQRSALQGTLFLVGVAWWRLRLDINTRSNAIKKVH